MRLWQKAQRPEATRAELVGALSVIPALCSAVDAASRSREADLDRLGRHLAHEVRNRLNLVESSLERAERLSGDDRVRDALEPVRSALANLVAVADDLHSAARPPEADGAPPTRAALRSVVDGVLAASRDLAEERGIRLEAGDGFPEVEVDAARLELVLINLLTNALRHGDPAKRDRHVRVECLPLDGGAGCRIGIHDNGTGIPAKLRARLFEEPASDGDGSPPRNGLGLAIVREAVERSGGRVWLESEEGVGTSVYFTLSESDPGPKAPRGQAARAQLPAADPR